MKGITFARRTNQTVRNEPAFNKLVEHSFCWELLKAKPLYQFLKMNFLGVCNSHKHFVTSLVKTVSLFFKKLRFQLLYLGIKFDSFKTVALTNCRYRVRMIGVHFRNLSTRFHQFCLYYKLVRLYLLDKSLCLSVLRSLNEVGDKPVDNGNGFQSGHNGVSLNQAKAIVPTNEFLPDS